MGDLGLIPGSERSPRESNGYPLQYSCLENSMHRGSWCATVHGVTKLDTTEWLTHIDRWNRIESLGINSCIYDQLIFGKGAKNMQWGKQMVLGKLDIKRPKRAWPPVITGLSVKPCFCCCCLVAQLYQTLCDPMDYSLTGSSIHGISQAGILEWAAISFQGIFLDQRSNLCLLHWWADSLPLSQQVNPKPCLQV